MPDGSNVMDVNVAVEKQKVPSETVLFLQGQKVDSLLVLHSGMVELVNTDIDTEGKTPEEIIESSSRVGLVKGESVCGITGLYNNQPLGHSFLAVSECIVTNKPVEHKLIVQTLQQNMKLNLQILHALIQRIESAIFLFRNYRYLWHKFASIQDSLVLGSDLSKDSKDNKLNKLPPEPDRYKPVFKGYAAYLSQLMEKQGERAPEPWDDALFRKLQNKLDLYKQYDNLRLEQMIDHFQYLFIKRLLSKQVKLVAAMLYKDGPTNAYIFNFLGDILNQLLKYNKDIAGDINKLTRILYDDKGWVPQFIKKNLRDNPEYQNFMHGLWKYSWSCHKDASKLLCVDLAREYPSYKKLLNYRASSKETETATASEENIGPEMQERLNKYKGLFNKILAFSDKPREFRDELTACLKKLKDLDDIHSTEKEHRMLRSRFNTLYWELYEACFLKIIDSDLKGFIPGIMLHFGLIDEEMVSKTELLAIDRAYSSSLAVDEPLSAMTLPYFLEKIYTGEVNPSINGTGEGFQDLLKRQTKMTAKEQQSIGVLYQDKPEDKVRYELTVVASEISRLTYGDQQKALPVLSSQTLAGSIDHLFLSAETCSETAGQFRTRDYSLFYRDIVCKHHFGTDIVKNEVLPNFVIYPVAGTRAIMWQEIDGVRKDTSARFIIPAFFMGKIQESIGILLGQFRWELARTSVGSSWMDPVDGGLSGAYYDYISFYKRNPNLTATHKEALKSFIKKIRTDRDRFASDYVTWAIHEYEGKMRFNPVVRDIFYRFVPFHQEAREEMAKKPLFTDLEVKRVNRTRKDVLRVESRSKRFEKANIPLPDQIKEYMEFLQL